MGVGVGAEVGSRLYIEGEGKENRGGVEKGQA